MKIKTSDRLFYRTFPYKAVLNNEWAVAATQFSIKDIPRIKKGDISDYGRTNRAARAHPTETCELIRFFDKFEKSDMRMRNECYNLSLFFKDRSIVDDLEKIAPGSITELWEPPSDEALAFMENNTRTVVKKTLTHGCRYKIVLQGDINKVGPEVRKNFIKLVKRNRDNFHISEHSLDSFSYKHRYFWGNYFFVKDSKHLLMAQMMIQPIIKEVVKIVTNDEVIQGEHTNV